MEEICPIHSGRGLNIGKHLPPPPRGEGISAKSSGGKICKGKEKKGENAKGKEERGKINWKRIEKEKMGS